MVVNARWDSGERAPCLRLRSREIYEICSRCLFSGGCLRRHRSDARLFECTTAVGWAGFLLRVPRRRVIVASRIFLDRRRSQQIPTHHACRRCGETIVLWHVHGIGLRWAAEVGSRRLYELLRRRFRSSFYRLIRASSDENTGWAVGGGLIVRPDSEIPQWVWSAGFAELAPEFYLFEFLSSANARLKSAASIWSFGRAADSLTSSNDLLMSRRNR
jgi:hypothetical protein